MSRRSSSGVLAVLALSAVLVAPVPARADGPMRLGAQLTDEVGALGARRGEAETALRRLRDDTGLQLFVVFVRSFDRTPAQRWVEQTATRSDLGDRDGLLAVATGDRAYAYTVDGTSRLTDAQLAEVAQVAIEPALAQNDWAGAVVGAADGYRAVLRGQPVPPPRIVAGEPDPDGVGAGWRLGAGVGTLACLLLPFVAVIGGVLLWARARRRRATGGPVPAGAGPAGQVGPAAGPPDPLAAVSTDELNARANTLLVELDDDLRASERELSLAAAQYGAEVTAGFRAALDSARAEVAEAFRLRLTLDDEPPPDEPRRRAVLAEIIRRCETADARLDAESEQFDALRDLEGRVEQVAAELDKRHAAAQARLPAAGSALQALQQRYAGATVAAVAGNAEQARERLAFATSALTRAGDAVGRGERSEAALAVRAAEQAIDQVEQLLDGIDRAGADLDAARAGVDALLTEVEADLTAARTALVDAAAGAPTGGGPDARAALSSAVAGAEQTLAAVRAGLAGPRSDPAEAVRQLEQADAALDRALAGARDTAERAARARALLDRTLPVARAEIAAAGDFITTRRGAVGGQARAWLAEAQRHLALAEGLAATDPVTALAEAQEAHRLAVSAGQAARDDVDRWSPPGGGFGGQGDPMGAFAGAVLGGILAGGMRQRGGWGGGGFGGGWGGGGGSWGGGGGGWSGGGFGGSGSRGRRTGGGRF
jgi:uncharacterized membrane protein YgcG